MIIVLKQVALAWQNPPAHATMKKIIIIRTIWWNPTVEFILFKEKQEK
jgi:hypothetical protein